MDSEILSCPTCSHTVSNAAGACTYCGAIMVKEEQLPQTEIKDIGATAAMPESPPPLSNVQSNPANQMSDPNAGPTASQQAAAPPTAAASSNPSLRVDAESEIELLYFGEEDESPASAEKQVSESTPEDGRVNPESNPMPEAAPAETAGTESVADAGSTADTQPNTQGPDAVISEVDGTPSIAQQEDAAANAAGNAPPSPDTETIDVASDETANSEMAVETEAAQSGTEAAQTAPGTQPATDKSPAAETTVDKTPIKSEKDMPPKNATVVDINAETASVSTGETILLDLTTEVEPATGEPPAANAVAANSKTQATSQKNNIPQADATKSMALKQQKAAQAKAQALKKQKILRAKAIALQRKKEAQAKAQAASAAAKNDKAAAAPASAKPASSTETGLRLHTLLEKYKGRVIGINYDNSAEIRAAQLVQVNAEFFSVFVKEKGLRYSYPISAILTVMEGKDGVNIDNAKQMDKFLAVFKLYPLVLF